MVSLILPEGLRAERLISDDYRRLQAVLHQNPLYGVASEYFAPTVAKVINQYQVEELLDYGAGKQRLMHTIARDRLVAHKFRYRAYDPAIPELAADPDPAEMVACIDVLEHVEPELLDNVLDDLQRVTTAVGLFTVGTMPAVKFLADGRNAHLTIEPARWWLPKILARWELHAFQKTQDGFLVLVKPYDVGVN